MVVQQQKRTWRCTDCGHQTRDRFEQTFCGMCIDGVMIQLPTGENMNDRFTPEFLNDEVAERIPFDQATEHAILSDPVMRFQGEADCCEVSKSVVKANVPTSWGVRSFDTLLGLSLGLAVGSILVALGARFALWILGIDSVQ